MNSSCVGWVERSRNPAILWLPKSSEAWRRALGLVASTQPTASNRAFSAWGEIFGGDTVVAAALIDQLVHHAEIISLKGSSYRLRGKETLAQASKSEVL